MNLLARIRATFRRPPRPLYSCPTCEQLAAIGMTRGEFFNQYPKRIHVKAGILHVEDLLEWEQRFLAVFYADYPELDPHRSKQPDDRDQVAPGTP
jgi:hypothetical protein